MTADGDRPIRVLHVEDDPDFADLAATMLEREHPGIEVETVGHADAGCAALDSMDVDCVVSDFDLPGADGLAFLARVREAHPDLPFILYTGKGSEEIASEAISAGVTDYLQKGGGREQYAVLANRVENAVDRYRTEAQLERERRRFELIGRASGDAFWDWEVGTLSVERTDGFARLFGYDDEEVEEDADWWLDRIHPDDRDRVEGELVETVKRGDDVYEATYRFRNADGSYSSVVSRGHVVRDDGVATNVVGTVTDVSDVERSERELAAVRSKLELVLEGTDTGVWEWDPGTDEVSWDRTVERLFGLAPAGFEGTFEAFIDRVHDDDRGRVERAIERAVEGRERYDVEFRIRRDDGDVRWVRAKGVPPDAASDVPGRFVGLINDVTEGKERERELRQYETIVEAVPDGVFVLDEDGVIAGGNALASEMLGFGREELIGTRFEELVEAGVVESGVVDRYLGAIRGLLSSDGDGEAQFEYRATVDGEERVFEARIALRPFEEEYRGTIGIVQDVTRRKEREERLERSERRFDAVFDDPSAFIGLLEPDGTLVLANDTALSFVGASPEDVTGRHFVETPWWDDETPEKCAEIERGIERAASGEFVRFEARHTGVEGRRIDVEGHLRPVTDESGSVVSVLVEGIDVTDRVEHERRIEELHETTRDLVRAADRNAVASAVVEAVTDILDRSKSVVRLREGEELRPVAYSEAAREAFGERPVLALGEGLPGQVYAEGEPMVFDDLDEVQGGNHPEGIGSSALLPVGDHGTLSIASEDPGAFDDSDVALARVLANNAAVVLDRLEGEQTLRRRERALTRQNERLDRFASMVSHDLRNPLAVAKGNLEFAVEEVHSPELEKVESSLARMEEIVEDVLSLARQGEQVNDPDPTELAIAVRSAWSSVDPEGATLDVAGDLGTCPADASKLQQLLENLFRNAVEHASPDVTVRVGRIEAAGSGDARVRGFYVEDDGPGIAEGEREQVFEFGWSGDGEGTGYGLAIVEEIAEAHGWEVAVGEGETGGARFEVTGLDATDAGRPEASAED